jgi:hypothetical protein
MVDRCPALTVAIYHFKIAIYEHLSYCLKIVNVISQKPDIHLTTP